MTTPGLEQAVLLVLEIEPLFIFISHLFVTSSFSLFVSQHLLSES